MPAFDYYREDLLQPISAESPSGVDLRHEKIFNEILDARRADDQLNAGAWEKQEGRKLANWEKVTELCLDAIKGRTKDLRFGCFLVEAALHLDGFEGFGQGIRLCRELIIRFWDQGIYPAIEDGDLDYRAASLSAINDPMPDILRQLPLTARTTGDNYSYISYQQALRLGTEASIAATSGERRETLDSLRKQGYVTMDAFEAAVKGTRRKAFEAIYEPFDAAERELIALSRTADEKFGDASPSFTSAREAMQQMRNLLDPILKKKREEEPDKVEGSDEKPENTPATQAQGGLMGLTAGLPGDQSQSWGEAEALVRGGQIDKGLAQMAALAANEASGRARFLRKLMLADVCLNAGRDRLAKTILEELKEQITQYKLQLWESSALVGAVWSRLYKIYRSSESSSEQEQAVMLYTQLCQLDPWQAYLHCAD